jgi:hypothetical protein
MSDYRRCYLLPDTVTCNIARRPTPGEPGSYGHARGLLVEISRYLRAAPARLHYNERYDPVTRRHIDIEITATVATTDFTVTVLLTHGSAPESPRGDYWELAINGRVPASCAGRHLPSLPMLGRIVDIALDGDPTLRADTASVTSPPHG